MVNFTKQVIIMVLSQAMDHKHSFRIFLLLVEIVVQTLGLNRPVVNDVQSVDKNLKCCTNSFTGPMYKVQCI